MKWGTILSCRAISNSPSSCLQPPDPEITVGYHTSSHSRFMIATFENISLQWSYCLAQAGLDLMAILPQILRLLLQGAKSTIKFM